MHIKIDNNSSARYYQKTHERLQKRLMKGMKILPKKKKKESVNMVANDIKIFPNLKNKGWLIIKRGKMLLNNQVIYNFFISIACFTVIFKTCKIHMTTSKGCRFTLYFVLNSNCNFSFYFVLNSSCK